MAAPLTSQTRLAFLFFLLFMIIILRWKENKKEKMQTMTERRTDRTGGVELKNFGLYKKIFLIPSFPTCLPFLYIRFSVVGPKSQFIKREGEKFLC